MGGRERIWPDRIGAFFFQGRRKGEGVVVVGATKVGAIKVGTLGWSTKVGGANEGWAARWLAQALKK